MIRTLFYVCTLSFLSAGAFAQAKKTTTSKATTKTTKPIATKVVMRNLNDSFSYAAGCNIASSMKEQGIKNVNMDLLQQALSDVFNNKTPLLTPEQANMTLQQQLQAFAQKKSEGQRAAGQAFLDQNKKRAGVTTLPDGLQYEIVKASNDAVKPKAEDTVVVHYIGTLPDGKEFDNSVARGEPATFPVNGVIRGWTEILQLMPKGSQWKVYIPSELAYGDRGAGAAIPPGSALVFDVTLLDVKPAAKQ